MTGHRVDRRTALAAMGAAGLGALLAACSRDDEGAARPATTTSDAPRAAQTSSGSDLFEDAASCTLTPEQTEGPFYLDTDSIRRDIREDRSGVPLRLALRVMDNESCTPMPDAVVDVWHSDAAGVYSGFDAGAGETFLRGAQVTNADGVVEFQTIYPGWYKGRTVHIHAKVHIDNSTVLTTQLYFDEGVSEAVFSRSPYDERAGRDTFNDDDNIFDDALILTLSRESDGYLGVMTFNVA